MSKEKDFHVVVWGATGFTGRLVARYLCEAYGVDKTVRWAIGGRNEEKLKAIQAELVQIDPDAAELTVLIGDSNDLASLQAMAQRTRVVLTTVGPYSSYGANMVEACVTSGADYVDLTGESPFIRTMIDAHHEDAEKAGRRVVHCCGFDSIPSDMGVFFLQQKAMEKWGAPLQNISFYLEKSKGGVSGGTIASMMLILDAARDPAVRRVLGNPYGLNPKDGVRGPDGSDQQRVRWDETSGRWTAPFVMAGINTRVVRRSNAMMSYLYGEDFSYREVMSLKKGLKGWWKAQSITVGLGMFLGLSVTRWTRSILQSTLLPDPGEGPSPAAQESGFFRIRLIGTGPSGRMEAVVRGKRDPGYGATSRMLTEAALCLALEREALPQRFGILTPASALGEVLLKRLVNADVTFEVDA